MAFEELKQKQSVMWGSGPYQKITETITDIHKMVVQRLPPKPGEQWLDLACGTGAVAERAARAGAKVTGIDLAPALLDQARTRAGKLGLQIEYQGRRLRAARWNQRRGLRRCFLDLRDHVRARSRCHCAPAWLEFSNAAAGSAWPTGLPRAVSGKCSR